MATKTVARSVLSAFIGLMLVAAGATLVVAVSDGDGNSTRVRSGRGAARVTQSESAGEPWSAQISRFQDAVTSLPWVSRALVPYPTSEQLERTSDYLLVGELKAVAPGGDVLTNRISVDCQTTEGAEPTGQTCPLDFSMNVAVLTVTPDSLVRLSDGEDVAQDSTPLRFRFPIGSSSNEHDAASAASAYPPFEEAAPIGARVAVYLRGEPTGPHDSYSLSHLWGWGVEDEAGVLHGVAERRYPAEPGGIAGVASIKSLRSGPR